MAQKNPSYNQGFQQTVWNSAQDSVGNRSDWRAPKPTAVKTGFAEKKQPIADTDGFVQVKSKADNKHGTGQAGFPTGYPQRPSGPSGYPQKQSGSSGYPQRPSGPSGYQQRQAGYQQRPHKQQEKEGNPAMHNMCKETVALCSGGGRVDRIKAEQVGEMVDAVCENLERVDRKQLSERERKEVLSTIIGLLLKGVAALPDNQEAYVRSLAPHLTVANKNDKDHNQVNSMVWHGLQHVKNVEGYVDAVREVISITKLDVLKANGNGETAVQSYEEAIRRKKAIPIPALYAVLRAELREENLQRMITVMVNKMSPQNFATFANTFKLGLLMAMQMLVDMILTDCLSTHAYSKKDRHFERISITMDLFKKMFDSPIVVNEWAGILIEKFRNCDGLYKQFLITMCEGSMKRITKHLHDDAKSLKSQSDDGENRAVVAIDALGAIIGQASVLLQSNTYTVLMELMFDQLSRESDQEMVCSIILSSTAHMVRELKTSGIGAGRLTTFMTPSVCLTITKMHRMKKFSSRIRIGLQDILSEFLDQQITCDKFDTIPQIVSKKTASSSTGVRKTASVQLKSTGSVGGYDVLNWEDEALEEPEKPEESEELDPEISQLIDFDILAGKSPKWLGLVDTVTVDQTGVWSDPLVDNWVYGLTKTASASDKMKIGTLVCLMANDMGVLDGKKQQLFKRVMDHLYTETTVRQTLHDLLHAKNISKQTSGEDELEMVFETPRSFALFKEFLKHYQLNY
jgi:hypothetical protein